MTDDIKRLILPALAAIILHGVFLNFKLPKQQTFKPVLKGIPIKLEFNSVSPKITKTQKLDQKSEIIPKNATPIKKDAFQKQIVKPNSESPQKPKKKITDTQQHKEMPLTKDQIVAPKIQQSKTLLKNSIDDSQEKPVPSPTINKLKKVIHDKSFPNKSINISPKTSSFTAPIQKKAVPIYRQNSQPSYPIMAKRRGHEGKVMLNVLVDVKGRVTELNIKQSSGHRSLDRAAKKAVEKWLFTPAVEGNKIIAMWVIVPIIFQLK